MSQILAPTVGMRNAILGNNLKLSSKKTNKQTNKQKYPIGRTHTGACCSQEHDAAPWCLSRATHSMGQLATSKTCYIFLCLHICDFAPATSPCIYHVLAPSPSVCEHFNSGAGQCRWPRYQRKIEYLESPILNLNGPFTLLKLINNSSTWNKKNHNREGGLDTRS